MLNYFRRLMFIGLFINLIASVVFGQNDNSNTTKTNNEPKGPATTTQGPEGSEITPSDHESFRERNIGLGVTFGQTLLSGDESDKDKGFNDSIGSGFFFSYRTHRRLNVVLSYWGSVHDSISTNGGDLNRTHFTGAINYYLRRGIFSPYGVGGVGLYASEFTPSPSQKALGLESSSVNTFGALFGIGGDFEVSPSFILGINWIRHHSFKRKNSERDADELVPFFTFGITGAYYF